MELKIEEEQIIEIDFGTEIKPFKSYIELDLDKDNLLTSPIYDISSVGILSFEASKFEQGEPNKNVTTMFTQIPNPYRIRASIALDPYTTAVDQEKLRKKIVITINFLNRTLYGIPENNGGDMLTIDTWSSKPPNDLDKPPKEKVPANPLIVKAADLQNLTFQVNTLETHIKQQRITI